MDPVSTLHKPSQRHPFAWCQIAVAATVVWEIGLIVLATAFSAAETRVAEPPRDKPLPKFRAPAVAEDGQAPNMEAKKDAAPADKVEPIAPQQPAAVCAANLGTNIQFVKDPPDAFQQARKEKKLVFFMHLAGNFEEAKFT